MGWQLFFAIAQRFVAKNVKWPSQELKVRSCNDNNDNDDDDDDDDDDK